jgi:serine protein kinase
MDVISHFAARFERTREEELSLEEYLAECKRNPIAYATAAERMLRAIGEPQTVDTRNDQRLSRLFANKVIKIYPAFAEFYGMEDSIEQVVSYFRHAAQGLEEKKQILYLLGPVGGGKSSIAERLKQLMQEVPFYAIKGSPVNESPLGLFDATEDGAILEKEYGIPLRYLNRILSPWAVKRLEEYGGDIRKFKVVKRYPSVLKQVAIAKTEPGDENNQDISSLVGKVDIRKLETYAQDDPDAYSYSGGLVPGEPGLARVRRNVQGADQGAAPLADGDAGRQLQGHRRLRRDSVRRHRARAQQRERVEGLPQQQEQRGLPRPHLHRQGAVLPAGVEEVKIYEKLLRGSSLAKATCAPAR